VVEYYHLAPVILTDSLFFTYFPPSECLYTGTVAQRNAAYLMAEQQMMREIGTFLTPTTVTGTYLWPIPYEPIVLLHSRVHSVDRLVVTTFDDGCSCDLTENPGCATIRSAYGYIDPRIISQAYRSHCGCGPADPYLIHVTYTAGLPTGVAANDTTLQMALAMAADMTLQELLHPGLVESAMAGITSWSAQGYSESRRNDFLVTSFGVSPRAQLIASMVSYLKLYRALRL
jgi:hypothetical protein